MFAHQITGLTGPDDVQWTEVADPPADGCVLIDVVAAGVSFADLLQTTGSYQMKVDLPYTPGMDAAGIIRSAPAEAAPAGAGPASAGASLVAGQRVAVLLSRGCWQEVISAPAARVLPLPADMSFEAGAAAPLNYLTALFALTRRARAQPGVLGFTAGQIPTVKVNRLLLGNTGVLGVASREFFEQRPATVADLWNELLELWRAGKLRDLPVQPYPFGDARDALRAIAGRNATGKVVLTRSA